MAFKTVRTEGREFQWARTDGVLGTDIAFASRIDLLAAARDRHGSPGGAWLEGATFMGARGYVRVAPSGGTAGDFGHARVGIRVADSGDLASGTPTTAGDPFEMPEGRWLWMLQCTAAFDIAAGGATSNIGTNAWAVDIGANRIMRAAADVLLMQCAFSQTSGGTDMEIVVDYDLSLGFKLA